MNAEVRTPTPAMEAVEAWTLERFLRNPGEALILAMFAGKPLAIVAPTGGSPVIAMISRAKDA